ncbi:unnamed protein product [marine sediment metagenome]|uniref:Uncharacterized protein n=1 Tax=marine sediment metagenome TaxID=412755 RepID=X1TYQ3_9ZZZZ
MKKQPMQVGKDKQVSQPKRGKRGEVMGTVLMLKNPGKKLSKMFWREYRCTNCFGVVEPLKDSWPLAYHCSNCNKTACNPRVCYRLKEAYKDIVIIGNLLEDLHLWDNTLYYGKLAVYVKAMHSFYQGGSGIVGRTNNYCLERN